MKTKFTTLITAIILLFNVSIQAQTKVPIAINIAGLADWSTEFIWVDIMKYMRVEHFGTGFAANQFDENGYPKYLNSGQSFSLGFGDGTNYIWPVGQYHIFYDGEGTLVGRNGNTTLVQNLGNGHMIFNVITSGGSTWFGFQVTATTPGNYMKNIRIIMPGFENTYQTNPYHPSFIEHWGQMTAFRFMDFTSTNGSLLQEWHQVKKASFCSYDGASTPDTTIGSPEAAVDLCNYMNKDAWFCMPHRASDDCMRQWATMVKNRLKPNLKVYVEYSNECWNWMFQQTAYCRDRGVEMGLTTGGALEYYTYRCTQMWKIWEDVFGTDKDRVINVFANQVGNTTWTEIALTDWLIDDARYSAAGTRPEVVASAPYIHSTYDCTTCSLDELFSIALNTDVPHTIALTQGDVDLAHRLGYEYMSYEAGQHFANPNLYHYITLYSQANRDPRMLDVYKAYLEGYEKTGAGTMFHFSSCSPNGPYGSWGALEYYNQDTSTAPKYLALKQYIATFSSDLKENKETLNIEENGAVKLYPNPTNTGYVNIEITNSSSDLMSVIITDSQNETVINKPAISGNSIQISTSNLASGIYFVRILSGTETTVKKLIVL